METEKDLLKPFKEFAGPNGEYYGNTFLKIQKAALVFKTCFYFLDD